MGVCFLEGRPRLPFYADPARLATFTGLLKFQADHVYHFTWQPIFPLKTQDVMYGVKPEEASVTQMLTFQVTPRRIFAFRISHRPCSTCNASGLACPVRRLFRLFDTFPCTHVVGGTGFPEVRERLPFYANSAQLCTFTILR